MSEWKTTPRAKYLRHVRTLGLSKGCVRFLSVLSGAEMRGRGSDVNLAPVYPRTGTIGKWLGLKDTQVELYRREAFRAGVLRGERGIEGRKGYTYWFVLPPETQSEGESETQSETQTETVTQHFFGDLPGQTGDFPRRQHTSKHASQPTSEHTSEPTREQTDPDGSVAAAEGSNRVETETPTHEKLWRAYLESRQGPNPVESLLGLPAELPPEARAEERQAYLDSIERSTFEKVLWYALNGSDPWEVDDCEEIVEALTDKFPDAEPLSPYPHFLQ